MNQKLGKYMADNKEYRGNTRPDSPDQSPDVFSYPFQDYGAGIGPGKNTVGGPRGQNSKSGSRIPSEDKYVPWDVVARPPQLRKYSFGPAHMEDKRSGLPRGRRTNRPTTMNSVKGRVGAKYKRKG